MFEHFQLLLFGSLTQEGRKELPLDLVMAPLKSHHRVKVLACPLLQLQPPFHCNWPNYSRLTFYTGFAR